MIDQSLELIERRLKTQLVQELSRTGLLFRLFSRVKEPTSIKEKFTRKTYSVDEKKMQDLVGFRVTTYFSDDLKIVIELCKKLFEVVDLEYDTPKAEEFKPLRKNMVCRMPEEQNGIYQELLRSSNDYELIDNTFEIQFRTTLSEGWHEVEHLMRYKCKPDWADLTDESRMLNGIYATLETNDQALKALFDDISYHHYKAKKWEAMMRNKLRLRFNLENLDGEIVSYLNENPQIGKEFFKLDRIKMINEYINSTLSFPTTFDNWMFFINYAFLKDKFILSKTPEFLMEDFEMALKVQVIE
ncbi:protein containing region found in RelA / SpoT proteins [Cecembia lonarensis]|uniref:Protein containing region found in RelA / SpoT proteins n=1 Tax=Cecembia lonarensis (strain CCUG 58316 / KCTC 22772 / LW9) TaxID=1225176 RepID=K1LVH4_CECL9|nr:protein containing region found in RelA / SpoT proteins [Cecembia lonarensis]EKB48134.1 protein containing region found in RelA / SpoT proteins [Cecembia lonarensis LW9]